MKNNYLAFSFFVLAFFSANAATIYVNSSSGNDANSGTVGAPYKTFHKAYTMAAASGDVINLTGTFDWSAIDETGDVNVTGYTINKQITIKGQGIGVTFIQAQNSPTSSINKGVFSISTSGVIIEDLTIRYGYISSVGCYGGGITLEYLSNVQRTLTLNNVEVTECVYSGSTSTSCYHPATAGGISIGGNGSTGGILYMNKCIVSNNLREDYNAYGAGGISFGQACQAIFNECLIANNTATSITAATWDDYASLGGGVVMYRGFKFNMTNCTLYGNTTNQCGAALNIHMDYYDANLTNNTIVNNTAGRKGGGINFQTLGGKLNLKNNIIANNIHWSSTTAQSNDIFGNTINSNIVDNGFNIIESFDNASSTSYTFNANTITGNQTNLFGTGISSTPSLNLNGSNNQTKNIALSLGSIAINSGSSTSNGTITIPTIDQRGKSRSGIPDIGSYEFIAPSEWIGTTSNVSNVTSNWANSVVPVSGEDVIISASAINDLVLTSNLTIGSLTFNGSNKKVDLGNFNLTATSINGVDATNYVKTSGTGQLIMTLANNATAIYPIGNSAYNPLSITNKSGASDVFSARVVDGAYMEGLTGSAITSTVLNRTWDITKTNANAGSGVDFVFNWNAGEVANGSFTTPKMNHYSSSTSNWEVPSVTSTVFGSNMLTVTGYTGTFSPFTIAEGTSALPIELTAFNANCTEIGTTINWQTASEHNSAFFEVEKSRDGSTWNLLESVNAAGNSSSTIDYSINDSEKGSGVVYYRLNQVDQNGENKIYGPISSNCFETSDFTASVFPNPASEIITIELNARVTQTVSIQICTTDGKAIEQIANTIEEGTTQIPLSIATLKAGIYTVKVNGENATQTIKLVIQ